MFYSLLFRPSFTKALRNCLQATCWPAASFCWVPPLPACPWRTSCRFYFIKQSCLHFQRAKGNLKPPESLHMMTVIKMKTFYPLRLDTSISWRCSEVPELAVGGLWYHGQDQWTHPSCQMGSIRHVCISTVELGTNCAFKKVAFLTLGWLICEVCY